MDYQPLTGGQERAYAQLEQRRLLDINAALLAALESCVDQLHGLLSRHNDDDYAAIDAAYAAIRKAKGGQ